MHLQGCFRLSFTFTSGVFLGDAFSSYLVLCLLSVRSLRFSYGVNRVYRYDILNCCDSGTIACHVKHILSDLTLSFNSNIMAGISHFSVINFDGVRASCR